MGKDLVAILMIVLVCFGLVYVAGCESRAHTGALIGTGVGAAAGQVIGRNTASTLIGAGIGAAGGYIIGNETDKNK